LIAVFEPLLAKMTVAGVSAIDAKRRYTVIRNKVYDITDFEHPGGAHLLSLGVGRDATILFESYHIRDNFARMALKQIPQIDVTCDELAANTDFNMVKPPAKPVVPSGEVTGEAVQAVDTFLLPGDSEMYQVLRERIRKEVLVPRGKTCGRGGVIRDTSIVLASFAAASYWFISAPSVLTAVVAGFCATWIGLAVQHTANHGALAGWPRVGYWLGMTDDLIGGSSLVWRYHHNVSHHLYTNDLTLDMDVYTSYPFVRLDPRQERHWYHRFQCIYSWVLFTLFYFSLQLQEIMAMLDGPSLQDVKFIGASSFEIACFWVLKAVHFSLFLGLPLWLHGDPWIIAYFFLFTAVGGFTLGLTFLVSHNLEQVKPEMDANVHQDTANRGILTGEQDANNICGDWCKWQIETSASWGGAVGSFFTGGLNLQIEHHLFPGIAHNCYPEIAVIVKEECKKRGVRYIGFDTLPQIAYELVRFLYVMGLPEDKMPTKGPSVPLLSAQTS